LGHPVLIAGEVRDLAVESGTIVAASNGSIALLGDAAGRLVVLDEVAVSGCCGSVTSLDLGVIAAAGRDGELWLFDVGSTSAQLSLDRRLTLPYEIVELASTNEVLIALDEDNVAHFLRIHEVGFDELGHQQMPGRAGRTGHIAASNSMAVYWGAKALLVIDLHSTDAARVLLTLERDSLDPQHAALSRTGVTLVTRHEVMYAAFGAIDRWSILPRRRATAVIGLFATDMRTVLIDEAGLVEDYIVLDTPNMLIEGNLSSLIPSRWWDVVGVEDGLIALSFMGGTHHLTRDEDDWKEVGASVLTEEIQTLGSDIETVGDYVLVAADGIFVGQHRFGELTRVGGEDAFKIAIDGDGHGVVLEMDSFAIPYRTSLKAFDANALPEWRETGQTAISGRPVDVAFCGGYAIVASQIDLPQEQSVGRLYSYEIDALAGRGVVDLPSLPYGISCVGGQIVVALGDDGVWNVELNGERFGEIEQLLRSEWAWDVIASNDTTFLVADQPGVVIAERQDDGGARVINTLPTPSGVENLGVFRFDGESYLFAASAGGLTFFALDASYRK
jgi:hypothetical protein